MSSLTAGASAEAEGAGPGAEDPQTQGGLPEASRTSGNVCFSLVAPGGGKGWQQGEKPLLILYSPVYTSPGLSKLCAPEGTRLPPEGPINAGTV